MHMSLKFLFGTKIWKLNLGYVELCDECCNFVNNIYSYFVKIIWIFYDRLMDMKYIITTNFTIFLQNLDIITIIMF
jgi:hypothetical protein